MYKGSDSSFSFAFFPDNETTKESFGLGGKLLEVLSLPSSEREWPGKGVLRALGLPRSCQVASTR